MDPKACLLLAVSRVGSGDYIGVHEALSDYKGWRNRGGFEPREIEYRDGLMDGDDLAAELWRVYADHELDGEARESF